MMCSPEADTILALSSYRLSLGRAARNPLSRVPENISYKSFLAESAYLRGRNVSMTLPCGLPDATSQLLAILTVVGLAIETSLSHDR